MTIEERTPAYFSMISNPVLTTLASTAYTHLGRAVQEIPMSGSTDMGNVSHVVPSMHPSIELIPGVVPHTREFAAAAGGPEAEPTIADGALLLAATAMTVFRHPTLAMAAREVFHAG